MHSEQWPDQIQNACDRSAEALSVSRAVHQDDFIFRFLINNPVFKSKDDAINYYFVDGKNSAKKVRSVLDRWLPARAEPYTVLEFASGYGAVTRHALGELSPHVLHSSDIHVQANDFLAKNFGVPTVQSVGVPEEFCFPRKYDMIFVLSFFSHMPRATWHRWLSTLYAGLEDNGILLFTTHGDISLKLFSGAAFDETGYWFMKSSEQGDLDPESYGQTVTSKAFVDAQVAKLPAAQHLCYEFGGWWGHQDLYVIRKLGQGA